VRAYLVHHGEAAEPGVDPRRPLTPWGRQQVERCAADAAARGAKPDVVWHSGKLRAKQTAEAYWRACNPLAEFCATKDLQPADPPVWLRDRLRGESRDVMIVGHFPHLPKLRAALLGGAAETLDAAAAFPQHGIVALETTDEGATWRELWRVGD